MAGAGHTCTSWPVALGGDSRGHWRSEGEVRTSPQGGMSDHIARDQWGRVHGSGQGQGHFQTLYLLGLASGHGDRDLREASLPLVGKEKEGAAGRATAQISARPDRLLNRAPDSHKLEVGGQEEDGLCHRLNCVPTKDLLKL